MASAPLHFAIGAAVGMAVAARRLHPAWRTRKGLSAATRAWLLTSWSFGAVATLPSLLRYAGIPDSVTGGPWMNIFFLHPLINTVIPAHHMLGGAALGITAAIQYGWILLAITRARKGNVP